MGYLFKAPTFHKFADMRVFAGRGAEQLTVIHVRQRFDVTHIEQDRYEFWVNRMIFDVTPGDRIDKLRRQ